MPRTAGPTAARLHGDAAGKVTVSARDDVNGVARRHDVMSVARFHGTASLLRLGNHCTQAAAAARRIIAEIV